MDNSNGGDDKSCTVGGASLELLGGNKGGGAGKVNEEEHENGEKAEPLDKELADA